MFSTLFSREARATKHGSYPPRDPVIADFLGIGSQTLSGVTVNEKTAMKFTAVYCAVRILSETKAMLPIKVYERRADGGKNEVASHPVAELLRHEPNREQTPFSFFEVRQQHVVTWGNSYTQIIRDNRGVPIELVPHHPAQWSVTRNKSGDLDYEFYSEGGGKQRFDRSQVLHVPNMSDDGLIGWSPIRQGMNAVGMGLAAERFGDAFYGNGVRPSAIVELPQGVRMDAKAVKDLQNYWQQFGRDGAGGVGVAQDGAAFKPFTMPLNEAQFIESRTFQIDEIARLYRIPPHMLGELANATFTNIESQGREFVDYTLMPYLVRDERELTRKLFTKEERHRFFVKHNVDALLRGESETRANFYASAITNGWMNRNEVRAKEDMNPVEGGDEFLVPLNMAPANAEPEDDQPDPPEEPPAEEPDETDGRFRRLLTETVEGLINREVRAAERAANKPGEFLAWLDEFYEKHQSLLMGRLDGICSQGRLNSLVKEHIDASRDKLLDAAGSPPEQFRQAVIDCVSKWPELAEQFTEELLRPEK